jgi:ABC-type bacteriocin/lantibiotic exporter with double-glycine peptidase domain
MRSGVDPVATVTPSLRGAIAYFWRLALLARPYWRLLVNGVALGLCVGLVGLVIPYFSKSFFDNVYPAHDISLMHVLVLGVAAFTLTAALMGALRQYFTQIVAAKLGGAIGLMYFNHLQHLPVRFFDQHRVGEIMSRLGDVRAALATLSRVLQTVLVNGVYLVLVPPFLMLLNWKLSLVALIASPVTAVISTLSGRVIRRYMKQSAEAGAELNAIQVEVLNHIRTLKSLSAERRVFTDARRQTEDVLRAQSRQAGVGAVISLANGVVRLTGTAVFTWYAWTLILNGELTLGGFVAFSAYLGYLTGPVGEVTSLFADLQQTAITFGRAFEYLDLEPEQEPELVYTPAAPSVVRLKGDIRLEHVSFEYAAERPVLQDVSLHFPEGSVTALVGRSGAGKSSVLRLLCGMEQANSGSILFDAIPIQQIALAERRKQLAVVWQEPTLFRGTIRENLVLGLDDVRNDAIADAVRACRLDELLGSLPAGYDTPVAEAGATVSGGQRQRMAIARALLRGAPILLLDEATSQMDVQTEEEVLRELLLRMRGRTVVLVTHRLATASLADQICLLEDGRVSAVGTHAELSRQSALYKQLLAAAQIGDDSRPVRMLGVTP